jgi:hypothetical protein
MTDWGWDRLPGGFLDNNPYATLDSFSNDKLRPNAEVSPPATEHSDDGLHDLLHFESFDALVKRNAVAVRIRMKHLEGLTYLLAQHGKGDALVTLFNGLEQLVQRAEQQVPKDEANGLMLEAVARAPLAKRTRKPKATTDDKELDLRKDTSGRKRANPKHRGRHGLGAQRERTKELKETLARTLQDAESKANKKYMCLQQLVVKSFSGLGQGLIHCSEPIPCSCEGKSKPVTLSIFMNDLDFL